MSRRTPLRPESVRALLATHAADVLRPLAKGDRIAGGALRQLRRELRAAGAGRVQAWRAGRALRKESRRRRKAPSDDAWDVGIVLDAVTQALVDAAF